MTIAGYFKLLNLDDLSAVLKLIIILLFAFTGKISADEITLKQKIPVDFFNGDIFQHDDNSMKLICFYVFSKELNPEIMADLCTHINVGFPNINVNNNSVEPNAEQQQILSEMMVLKKRRKKLKIIICLGGAGDNSFSLMVTHHKSRKQFIRSVMKLIKKFELDGIDLDWEWPVVIDGNQKEKIKFIQLLHEIREEFARHKKPYILSVDVSSTIAIIELSYIVRYIAEYVDYVNVMCYDYHYFSKWFPFTGHNAPLFGGHQSFLSDVNVNNSVYYWILNSMPREKIIIGLPTYGHTYQLLFPDKHSLGAPAKGFGSIGKDGFASYQDICEFLNNQNATVVFDSVSKVPYAYQYPEWISFDNEKSITLKASYILDENLGGAMVFSANADDFSGNCSPNRLPLPLIRKVRSILFNAV